MHLLWGFVLQLVLGACITQPTHQGATRSGFSRRGGQSSAGFSQSSSRNIQSEPSADTRPGTAFSGVPGRVRGHGTFDAKLTQGLSDVNWCSRYPETEAVADAVALPEAPKPVKDPYQWLENDPRADSKVSAWVQQQELLGEAVLAQFKSDREMYEKEIREVFNVTRIVPLGLRGSRWFFSRKEALQTHFVYYYTETLSPQQFVQIKDPSPSKDLVKVLDLNSIPGGKTLVLNGVRVSRNGDIFAYSVGQSGSDWKTLYFKQFHDGDFRDMPEETVQFVRWEMPVLKCDSSGYYLVLWDKPAANGGGQSQPPTNPRVFYKEFGVQGMRDVWGDPSHNTNTISVSLFNGGRWLVIHQYAGAVDNARVFMKDTSHPERPVLTLYDNFENINAVIGMSGQRVLIITDSHGAEMKKIVYRELINGGEGGISSEEKELVAEDKKMSLGPAHQLSDGTLVLQYTRDAVPHVQFHSSFSGRKLGALQTPSSIGSVTFLSDVEDGALYYSFQNMLQRATIFRYNIWTGKHALLYQPPATIEESHYETKQIFVPSGDVRVPAFVVMRRGQRLDGRAPAILFGYGAYQVSMLPIFISWLAAWLNRGGIYVRANIRGGGEYGEQWHVDGSRERKQNSFNDFMAIAEYLIAKKYTSASRLGIYGISNGGLLVGACLTQRPHLFGAAVAQVGIEDMLRFHKFTSGVHWKVEFGDPEKPEDFEYLLKYSPYHKALATVPASYPPTLIMTADNDDRVVPAHSYKFLAALQRAQNNTAAPVVLRVEKNAGHDDGSWSIASSADLLAFFTGYLMHR